MDAPGPNFPEPGPPPGAPSQPFAPPAPAADAGARRPAAGWLWSRSPSAAGARSRRRKVTTGLVVLALAAGGGVAIAATTDTATPAPSETAAADAAGAEANGDVLRKRGGAMGLKLGMLGRGGAVHGEFTVPDGDGGYRTVLTQNGTVTAVDGGKLTVKSADGWSKDYTLDTATMIGGARFWSPDAGADLTAGQEVMVMGTVKDGTAHAEHVQTRPDKAALEKHRADMKFGDMRFGHMEMAPGDMKRRMLEKSEGRGDRVLKFRGGPGEVMPGMPAMPHDAPEMTQVEPAPEAATGSAAPEVENSFFVQPYEESAALVG